MKLRNIAMLLSNTGRSKAYLQAMCQRELFPEIVILLKEKEKEILPGQNTMDKKKTTALHITNIYGFQLDFSEPLESTLKKYSLCYETIFSSTINDAVVTTHLQALSPEIIIYSGIGGILLKEETLAIGKKFLHVHGGYLPDFKGSTTQYYSLLKTNTCGASAVFLTSTIDSGPILHRKTFPPPEDRTTIDYVMDSVYRTNVLIDTLAYYAKHGDWFYEKSKNNRGTTYYIIHPLLKHIAIYGRSPS